MAILKNLDVQHYDNIEKGWYLAYYYKMHSEKEDLVSNYLLSFKNGTEPITSKWIEIATSFFTGKLNPDLIIRVLKSEETHCSNSSSLDKLGAAISKCENAIYSCKSLYKIRQTQPLKFLNKHDRFREVNEVYRFIPPKNGLMKILLLDDISTTGTTINEISRAIESEIKDFKLFLFVLGKTYDSYVDNNEDNNQILQLLNA